MTRNCPGCGNVMHKQAFHNVELDICQNCGGVWFDAEELRSLLQTGDSSLGELDSVVVAEVKHGPAGISTFSCPNDLVQLNEYHYMYDSPAVMHTCPTCAGFWVSEEDLKKMQEARAHSHDPMTPQENAALVLAQATAEHEREMQRLQDITTMFSTFRRYPPGWYGLWI